MVVIPISLSATVSDSIIDAKRDYGLLADGSDETSLVQTITNDSSAGGTSYVRWPTGRIGISATIDMQQVKGLHWQGAGHIMGFTNASGGGFYDEDNVGGTVFEWIGTDTTGTNLQTTADASGKVVTPDGYTPVDRDVNTFIQVTAGTGWTTGFYRILSHDGTSWTLDESPAAPSTTGGSWELDKPDMFRLAGVRGAGFHGITFCSQLMTGSGPNVGRIFNLTNDPLGGAPTGNGDGHLNFADCSFALDNQATAFECGVEFPNNAADINWWGCEFWGKNLGASWADRKNHCLILNHLQNVNYHFNSCAIAFVSRVAWVKEGGAVTLTDCAMFENEVTFKADQLGKNNDLFKVSGCRFDRSFAMPLTLFDCTDANGEPHILEATNCLWRSGGPSLTTYPPPLILAKHQTQVNIRNSQLSEVPIVRWHGIDTSNGGKTALTSCVMVDNCEMPVARPLDYIQGAGGDSGKWIQIDQTDPAFGYFRSTNCRMQQRPVDDFEAGVTPGYFRNPDTEDTFAEWLNDTYTVAALWELNEPPGATEIINYATGGSPFAIFGKSGTNGFTDLTATTEFTPDGYTVRSTDLYGKIRIEGGTGFDTGEYTIASVTLPQTSGNNAQGSTSTTIQLAASETFGDDALNDLLIKITGGFGAGQVRLITDYVGSTDTATITPAWDNNPDTSSEYEVGGRWVLDRPVGTVNTSGGLWTFLHDLTGHAGPVRYQTGMDFALKYRGGTSGAFDTGVDITMDSKDYTFFGFYDRYAREPAETQMAMTISNTSGDSRDDVDISAHWPFLNAGANFDWAIQDDDNSPDDPHNTIFERSEGPGYAPIIWTWDRLAGGGKGTTTWYWAGIKSDIADEFTMNHMDLLTGNTRVYLGGYRVNDSAFGPTTLEWRGKLGRIGIIEGKLTEPQIAELYGRMTMSGLASYPRTRTP